MSIKNLFIITICISLFTGCSFKTNEYEVDMSKKKNSGYSKSDSINKKYQRLQKASKSKHGSFDDYANMNYMTMKSDLNKGLYNFYSQWQGVRYQMGGESRSGIDCSGFVRKVFREKFDLDMPRTALLQSDVGKEITKDELEVGDLVFFKTGKTNHVGVYVDKGKFIHASTKIGVTISDLNSDYYLKNYWKSQRVID